jgi:hypothetical protein
MNKSDAYFQAGLQRAIDADLFLDEFGPLVRSLLTAEKERFETDPNRPNPNDERLGYRHSEIVSLGLEVLGEWLDNDPRKGLL